jgi:antitoxin (DNA-binding transcriptional repressor) of toxin-antitoxin stability system
MSAFVEALMPMREERESHMPYATIAELKSQLSNYLSFSKNGQKVVVRDHNVPAAKPVPFSPERATDQELLPVAAGKRANPRPN